jgi:hypothetical protein
MRRVLLAAVLYCVVPSPSFAEFRIVASPGGEVVQYLRVFKAVRDSGQRVVIDGPCYSACTLVLSTVPRDRICVTSRAILGFHAPRWIDRQGKQYAASNTTTQAVADTYPTDVQAWISRHGGLKPRPILLRGRELASMYRRCS